MLRTLAGYAGAVATTYLVGVVAASQHVMNNFESMSGASLDLSQRADWAFKDVAGMLSPPIYPLAIAVMILIAFAVCGFVVRRIGRLRTFGFVLAGAVGMVALHLILNGVFEINSIAASRTLAGLAGQALAGACGGLVYILLHPADTSRSEGSPFDNAGNTPGAAA